MDARGKFGEHDRGVTGVLIVQNDFHVAETLGKGTRSVTQGNFAVNVILLARPCVHQRARYVISVH